MEIKCLLEKIGEKGSKEDIQKIFEILDELICDMKENHKDRYNSIVIELKEMAYGEIIDEDTAIKWVEDMKPFGKKWSLEQTTEVMHQLGYDVRDIDFFVVANMMYNDYYEIVKDNEELTFKMAEEWLKDIDAKKNKLYYYYKYVI